MSDADTWDAPPTAPAATKVTSAGRLWMRKWSLIIGPNTGATNQSLDLSALGFSFDVSKTQLPTSWIARVTIYNINATILGLLQTKLTNIQLMAGYQPPSQQYGLIFAGQIAWFRYGRQNATDTFVELHCIGADEAKTQAVVNTALPAGHTAKDCVSACVDAMKPYGVTEGYITDLGNATSPRGRTLFGMARDILRDIAHSAHANYHIDDAQKLHILKEDEAFHTDDTTVPVLTSKSGMVDVPVVNPNGGVTVRSLLNYAIKPGGRVKIDQSVITRDFASPSGAIAKLPTDARRLQIESMGWQNEGVYVVGGIRHFGETRGTPWFTNIISKPQDTTGINKPTLRTSA